MANYIELATSRYPVSQSQIRAENPQTSYPASFPVPDGFALVFPAPAPTVDPITQIAREIAPVLTQLGTYQQAYEIVELDAETIAANQARKAEQDAATIANKIEQLWSAADKYVNGYISGVAIGILTIGVIQAKPKCLAVTGWSQAIWTEYYVRKAGITLTSELDLDFTSFGPMPHTVPELQAEIGL
jgi:hypothetical protein